MDSNRYTFEIRIIQMLLMPPWSIFMSISNKKLKSHRKVCVFLLSWVSVQWLLLISTGANFAISYLSSNLAMTLFFGLNIYYSYDVSNRSQGEKDLLYNMPFMFIVTVTSFLAMFAFPKILSVAYSDSTLSNTIEWSYISITINIVLIVLWIAFMLRDRYEIFSLFPKSSLKHERYQDSSFTEERQSNIIWIYVIISIGFFSALIM